MNALAGGVRSVVETIRLNRVPIAIAAIAFSVFAFPPQSIELYRTFAQGLYLPQSITRSLIEILSGLIGVAALCVVIWSVLRETEVQARSSVHGTGIGELSHRVLQCVVPLIPLCGLALGLFLATIDRVRHEQIREVIAPVIAKQLGIGPTDPKILQSIPEAITAELLGFSAILERAGQAILVVAFVACLGLIALQRRPRYFESTPTIRAAYRWRNAISLACLVTAGAFIIFPQYVGQVVGPVATFCSFCVISLWILSRVSLLGDWYKLPLLSFWIILMITFGAFGVNDNHSIRTGVYSGAVPREPAQHRTIDNAFKDWWNSRLDKHLYSDKNRYPIYVVAAPGGGIYAAYHVAGVLSALRDQCRSFTHHLFAVSGVSGGSVGATVFAALSSISEGGTDEERTRCARRAPRSDSGDIVFSDVIESVFDSDILAPLVAGALFSDLFQRTIPYPFDVLDRSRPFEIALENAFSSGIAVHAQPYSGKPNPLSAPFLDYWSAQTDSPALLLNTTEVESGERRVIAPFSFGAVDLKFLPIWPGDAGTGTALEGMSMSTAASLSARFPWLSPAGWFTEVPKDRHGNSARKHGSEVSVDGTGIEGRRVALVDGGYFDNSGIVTARDAIREMERVALSEGFRDLIEVNLVVLINDDDQSGQGNGRGFFWQSEITLPIVALLSSWTARSRVIVVETERSGDAAKKRQRTESADDNVVISKLSLRHFGYPQPLGWRLSAISSSLIQGQGGYPMCGVTGGEVQGTTSEDCMGAEILRRLWRP